MLFMLLETLPFDDDMNTVPFSLHWPWAVGAIEHIKMSSAHVRCIFLPLLYSEVICYHCQCVTAAAARCNYETVTVTTVTDILLLATQQPNRDESTA